MAEAEQAGVGDIVSDASFMELRTQFDAAQWQVSSTVPEGSSFALLTWTVVPEPIDAGAPPIVQQILAETLCHLGVNWFGSDEVSRSPGISVRVRRGPIQRIIRIARAEQPADVLSAFNTGTHDWSMAAQWIVVTERPLREGDQLKPLLVRLFEDWNLPAVWPPGVLAIVQAGVDGDGAGIYCRSRDIDDVFRKDLQRTSEAHGLRFNANE